MVNQVQAYPAEVVAVNGSVDPLPPGPASSFKYDLAVTTEQRVEIFRNVVCGKERWPDTYNVNPIRVGTLVGTFRVGRVLTLDSRELPHTTECAGGDGLPISPSQLIDILRTASEGEKLQLREALGL